MSGVSLVRLIECVKYNFHGGCGCGCGFQGGCVCGFQGGCCGVSVGAVLGDYTFPLLHHWTINPQHTTQIFLASSDNVGPWLKIGQDFERLDSLTFI